MGESEGGVSHFILAMFVYLKLFDELNVQSLTQLCTLLCLFQLLIVTLIGSAAMSTVTCHLPFTLDL